MGWVNDFQPLGKELQQANIASDIAGVWPYTIWIQKKSTRQASQKSWIYTRKKVSNCMLTIMLNCRSYFQRLNGKAYISRAKVPHKAQKRPSFRNRGNIENGRFGNKVNNACCTHLPIREHPQGEKYRSKLERKVYDST